MWRPGRGSFQLDQWPYYRWVPFKWLAWSALKYLHNLVSCCKQRLHTLCLDWLTLYLQIKRSCALFLVYDPVVQPTELSCLEHRQGRGATFTWPPNRSVCWCSQPGSGNFQTWTRQRHPVLFKLSACANSGATSTETHWPSKSPSEWVM